MVCGCQAGSLTIKLATSSLRVRFFILPVMSSYWLKLPRSTTLLPQEAFVLPFWIAIGQTKNGVEFLTSYLLVLRMILIQGCGICFLKYLACITIMRAPGFINHLANSVELNKKWTSFAFSLTHTCTQASLKFGCRASCILFSALLRSLWPEPGQSKLLEQVSGHLLVKSNQAHGTEALPIKPQKLIERRF